MEGGVGEGGGDAAKHHHRRPMGRWCPAVGSTPGRACTPRPRASYWCAPAAARGGGEGGGALSGVAFADGTGGSAGRDWAGRRRHCWGSGCSAPALVHLGVMLPRDCSSVRRGSWRDSASLFSLLPHVPMLCIELSMDLPKWTAKPRPQLPLPRWT